MKRLSTLTAAAALLAAVGFSGAANAIEVLNLGTTSHDPDDADIHGDIFVTDEGDLNGVDLSLFDVLWFDEHTDNADFFGRESDVRDAMLAGDLGLVGACDGGNDDSIALILDDTFVCSGTPNSPLVLTAAGTVHSSVTGAGIDGGAAFTLANIFDPKDDISTVPAGATILMLDDDGDAATIAGLVGLSRYYITGQEPLESSNGDEEQWVHNAIHFVDEPLFPPGTVEKELISGPNDRLGVPIVVDVDPLDDGGILVLSPDTQRFEFKITITNDGENNEIDGLKVFDVVGAEFDPDCDAEDGTIDDPEGTAACPDGPDDGIDDTGGTGLCTATITPHASGRKKDPHFILIVLDTLLAGETCVVTVWVNTDENPSSVKKTGEGDGTDPKEKFSPTSCDLVMEPDLFNTFTLNEGLKVFDPDSGIRLLGPVGSLQLTCNFPV